MGEVGEGHGEAELGAEGAEFDSDLVMKPVRVATSAGSLTGGVRVAGNARGRPRESRRG